MSGDDLEVRVMNFDLLRILAGNELTLETVGGTRVRVRLYTSEELMAEQVQATGAGQPGGPEPMSEGQAIALTLPMHVEALIGRQP